MPIDAEQWRAQTGLFCASQRVLLRPPRYKQPKPKVQADTLSLNIKFSLAVLLVTLRTGVFYASRTLRLLWLIACHTSQLLLSPAKFSCKRPRGVSILLALCLVVVAMLLIMSGDVEENPGPQTPSLGVSDLSCVREELLDVSHNWFDIGLKLQLNVGTLERIRVQYPDPATSLREMLLDWLKKVDPPPTWEALASALESRTVGEPRLAEQLRTKYCKTVQAAGEPVEQPLAFKEGRPASHPPIYGPVSQSPAHTAVDRYASYLRSVYTSKKLPTYSKWPPFSATKYIHLAVVKKERVSKRKADEFTKATIHGTGIDNIYQKKEAVDFSRVGKREDGLPAKLILVEGAPGIGKTTFAWEVCRKWANGEILQEYGLVVLLCLRDKRVREVKTVVDLFHHPDSELSSTVGKEILHHEGQYVLLLYEGYSELPQRLQEQQSIFLDILRKQYLPHATILITSRPSATGYLRWEFREQISQHIEILGFTKDDIISYVHDVIVDERMRRDFFEYLKCYPYIHGMMYLPLNAVIVTEVYKESQQSPKEFRPITMTKLYTALTRSILLRYLLSHREYGQQKWILKSFTDLPKELYEQFCCVTRVALKGMIEDKFVFDDLPNDFNSLDLMQSVPELYVEQGALKSYNFFHLTLQEYLAAVNISQLPVEKQMEYFQTSNRAIPRSDKPLPHLFVPHTHVPTPLTPSGHTALLLHSGISTRLRNVLRFVAGLTKFKGIPSASLRPLILEDNFITHRDEIMALKSLHWLFETQCSDIYNEMITCRSSTHLSFTGESTMSPFDCFVLGYAIAHITCHWEIKFQDTSIGDEGVEMLAAGINFDNVNFTQSGYSISLILDRCDITSEGLNKIPKHVSQNMTKLRLIHNGFGVEGAIRLAELLKENRTLQQLSLSSNSIGQEGATRLAKMLKENWTLQQLDVKENSIGQGGAKALAEMLKENRTLQHLNVSGNSICQEGATALVETLKQNGTLQRLDISNNSIGQGGTKALAEMLKENRTLQHLNVSGNSICQEGATTLAEILKENRTLQQLDISNNSIYQGGAKALAEMLKENSTLQHLNVSGNSIGQEGAIVLAEMLKENGTLQQLDVSNNSIGLGGTTVLAEMLKDRTLRHLNVSGDSISQEGATALAEMLKQIGTLQRLDISNNDIGPRGAKALAEMLKENSTLQYLNVSGSSIGQEGATALADILKQNGTLQRLDISNNFIGQGGAKALAEMLKKNRTLQHLNVSASSIGHEGAAALADMLKENRTLQHLTASDISIGEKGTVMLVESLECNSTLEQLALLWLYKYKVLGPLSPAQKGRLVWYYNNM